MEENIVALEWAMFQAVQNIGGRASCQDDYETFRVMRTAQAMSWSEEIKASLLRDMETAEQTGRNLVAEKYARMMETTDPGGYEAIAELLPPVSTQAEELARGIAEQMAVWCERAAEKYPRVCSRGRAVRRKEDRLWVTSLETYWYGELLTYSGGTLRLIRDYCAEKEKQGENLYVNIQTNTASLLGFHSLDELEETLQS